MNALYFRKPGLRWLLGHGIRSWHLGYIGLVALSLSGCAYLHSTTEDANGVKTSVRAYALFESQNQLLKFANRGTTTQSNQWAPGTSIGSLNETATSSNLVNVISAVAEGVVKGFK